MQTNNAMAERFSETLMEHFADPRNRGRLDSPTGVGVTGMPGDGPFIVFQIECMGSRITSARFQCHNCGVTVACGSMLTELVMNRHLDDCATLDNSSLIEALDGVPVDKLHSVNFVMTAMKLALADAQIRTSN